MGYSILFFLCAQACQISIDTSPTYLFSLDSDFQLKEISIVRDPYSRDLESIWHSGNYTSFESGPPVHHGFLVERDNVVIIDHYYRKAKDSVIAERDFTVYQGVFSSIELIKTWLVANIGDKRGNLYHSWNRRESLILNEFLAKNNREILADHAQIKEIVLSKSDSTIIYEWIWSIKMQLYFYDTTELNNVIDDYRDQITPSMDRNIAVLTLPFLEFVNYRYLQREIGDRNGEIKYLSDSTYNPRTDFDMLMYCSLIYCAEKLGAESTELSDSSSSLGLIYLDATKLRDSSRYEVAFLQTQLNSAVTKINLSYRTIDKDLNEVIFRDTLNTSIVVVEIWGTWCKPCLKNMPEFKELAKKHEGQIQFVAIAKDDRKSWLKYIEGNDLKPIVHLLAVDDLLNLVAPKVSVFPTYLIINGNGELIREPLHVMNELKSAVNNVSKNK